MNQLDLNQTCLHQWRHHFSENEIIELKEESFEKRKVISSMKAKLKEQSKAINLEIKELEKEDKEIFQDVKNRFKDMEEQTKVEMDYVSGLVNYISLSTGQVVDSVKMTREQKKSFISSESYN